MSAETDPIEANTATVNNNASGTFSGTVIQTRDIHGNVQFHTAPKTSIVPRQLPTDIEDFVGRRAAQAALDELLDETKASGRAVVISAIDGTAGIGKTALAVHWAHCVRELFPGG
ncbi:MAG TPA: hypothetical protein VGR06_25155, partial [Actinophytocola sp.]|nr:hypothetical protein [Actinophytocola sp.]